MGLAERLNDLQATQGRMCPVARLMAEFDQGTREAFELTLGNLSISNNKIRAVLLEEGIPMSRDTISDHRRGRCACGANR